jgi:hypothetical protein
VRYPSSRAGPQRAAGAPRPTSRASLPGCCHSDASQIVEIRYGPALGPMLSWIAPSLVPRLSFWFDRAKPNPWLAHRIPLYGDGPEVLVIRDGIPPRWLSDE